MSFNATITVHYDSHAIEATIRATDDCKSLVTKRIINPNKMSILTVLDGEYLVVRPIDGGNKDVEKV
jgi:hypothetical protein